VETISGIDKFFDYFKIIADWRQENKVKHILGEILFISVSATLCGMDDWELIEEWALNNEELLKRYLKLPYGIPSHHTYKRIFNVIAPKQFEKCFIEWMKDVTNIKQDTVVAIDGKTMRRTGEKATGKKALHIVSAWCSENGLVLGQVKTEEKSNEITAIPELLSLLSIKDAIVTIDAMGTQKDIAKKIVKENLANYILPLKANQPTLKEEVESYFKDIEESEVKTDRDKLQTYTTKEKGHGRIEERKYYFTTDIEWLDARNDWEKLKGIGMVKRTREVNGEVSHEMQCYISSLDEISNFSHGVRQPNIVSNILGQI
jgi:predicted transposase YbfD/YdcC